MAKEQVLYMDLEPSAEGLQKRLFPPSERVREHARATTKDVHDKIALLCCGVLDNLLAQRTDYDSTR